MRKGIVIVAASIAGVLAIWRYVDPVAGVLTFNALQLAALIWIATRPVEFWTGETRR